MAVKKTTNRFWTAIAIFLLITIVIGGRIAWSGYRPSRPLEIAIAPAAEFPGRIYIGGAVTSPGFYRFTGGDSIATLIKAAGGATSANFSGLRLYLPGVGEEPGPQKININRAEAWLLEALPGIGETLAQRIIDYRQQNGPFPNTGALLKVPGIGATSYQQIEPLITVADG